MIQAVIFDLDGTLVDSVDFHATAWQKAFAEFGKKFSFEEIRAQIGKGGDELLPTFLTDREVHSFGEELKKYRAELFKKKYLHRIVAFPQVRDLFERIKDDGKSIGLGSSAAGDELEHYLKLADIKDLVDAETSADDVDRSKPNPDIFAVALKKLNVTAADALVVGDSPFDALAACKLHLPAIGVLCGGFKPGTLREAGVSKLYKDPADLLVNYAQSPICA